MIYALMLSAALAADEGSERRTQLDFDLKMATQGINKQKGDLYAGIHTSVGEIIVRLWEHEAPNAVANFVGLARGNREWQDPQSGRWWKHALYRNVSCHRVIPDFMIQCGDPTGTGRGGPGYTFADEISPKLHFDRAGLLAMANRGPNTNGSQFFITDGPTPNLDGKHTLFGEVIKSLDLVDKIARVPVGAGHRPENEVLIKSIDIFRAEKTPK
jgi:peptidyl-prolyl cis-trans isomerase A (cyclophilin A)